MEVSLLFGLFMLLMILRVPIAYALIVSSMTLIFISGLQPTLIVQQMFQGLNNFTLLAVPFFLLAGQLLNEGRITDRLLAFAQVLVGHIRGGVAHVNVVVSMMFGGMSGSSTADVAAIGSVMIPAMKKKGFSETFAVALTASTSTMGVIIPPSILMVVYGGQAGASIGAMFLAGATPGFLVGFSQMTVSYIYAVRHGMQPAQMAAPGDVARVLPGAVLPLMIPVIVMGGVLSGKFTATESGMIAVFYTMVLMYVVLRTASIMQLPRLLRDAAILTSTPLLAAGGATIFGWLLAFYGAPDLISQMMVGVTDDPSITLMMIAVLFLVVGCFMDAIPAIIIFMPIIGRLIADAHVDPVHAGLVVVMTLALGLITPPYGICLLLGSMIAGISPVRVIPQMLVFYVTFLVIVLVVIFIPDIALWLPKLVIPQAFPVRPI